MPMSDHTDTPMTGDTDKGVPVELSAHPPNTDGKRVLGVVPGKPVAGERKIVDRDDSVLVWPHLLVRHAVAAMGTLLLVMIIALLFDAPLRDIANPQVTPNPEKAPRTPREGSLCARCCQPGPTSEKRSRLSSRGWPTRAWSPPRAVTSQRTDLSRSHTKHSSETGLDSGPGSKAIAPRCSPTGV